MSHQGSEPNPARGTNNTLRESSAMSSDTTSLLVIVPAYNEEGAIRGVVQSVREVLPNVRIIVIDDGSWDNTAPAAEGGGADVFRLPHHLGLGGAVQTGYRFAYEHGYERVVRVDGDGQHNPADIEKLLQAMDQGDYDMVSGSRFLEPNGYPARTMRRYGSLIFSWILWPILGKRMTDPTSGFVAVNRRALETFSRSFPLEYPEIEALVVLKRKALKFSEVPAKMFPRRSGHSTINSWTAAYYITLVQISLLSDVSRGGGTFVRLGLGSGL